MYPSPMDLLKAVNSMDSCMECCIDMGTARAGADAMGTIHAAGPRIIESRIRNGPQFFSLHLLFLSLFVKLLFSLSLL